MAHSQDDLQNSANWTIVTKELPGKLESVKVEGEPPIAHFSFWRDGDKQMVLLDVPLDTPKDEIERRIEAALSK
jgi:hypothetical protein